MNSNELGPIIRYHRERAGLSRIDLAALAGVGKTVVFDIEHGKQTIQLRSLLRVMDALNITMQLESPLMAAYHQTSMSRNTSEN